MLQISHFAHLILHRIHSLRAALIDSTFPVTERNVLNSCLQKQTGNRDGCSSGSVHHHMNFFLFLSNHFQCIGQSCKSDDSRSMLIIVKDWNIAFFFQFFLNFKASWCRDIFQIHSTKRTRDQINRVDDLIYIMALDTQRECIHITKCLK